MRVGYLDILDRRNEADTLIALVHNPTVVTRNARDFDGTGAIVVDPLAG